MLTICKQKFGYGIVPTFVPQFESNLKVIII